MSSVKISAVNNEVILNRPSRDTTRAEAFHFDSPLKTPAKGDNKIYEAHPIANGQISSSHREPNVASPQTPEVTIMIIDTNIAREEE
jgi:hypothetical protein